VGKSAGESGGAGDLTGEEEGDGDGPNSRGRRAAVHGGFDEFAVCTSTRTVAGSMQMWERKGARGLLERNRGAGERRSWEQGGLRLRSRERGEGGGSWRKKKLLTGGPGLSAGERERGGGGGAGVGPAWAKRRRGRREERFSFFPFSNQISKYIFKLRF